MKKRFIPGFLALLLGLLWLLPGCKKDPLDGKTTITGRVTEYGTQTPVADATLYLMCYSGTLGGGGTSNLLDSVRTDADGRYSISYTDCGSTYLIPYKKGYLQHIDVDLGGSKTVDIVLDPEAWLKVVTVPDGGLDLIWFKGTFTGASGWDATKSKGTQEFFFLTNGNKVKSIRWGTYSQSGAIGQDSVYLTAHDTLTYTIHY